MRVAQTNVQLYNQLRGQGYSLDDVVLVHRAYELALRLYSGHYMANGRPFAAHSVGVASIVASVDQPSEVVAAGLLHNVYGNGDFGDGRRYTRTSSRRRLVREAVGDRLESLVYRFADLRMRPETIEGIRQAIPQLDDTDRRLLLVDIADQLEKYVDLGVLYLGECDWILDRGKRIGREVIEIADELGEPQLGEMLSAATAKAAAEAPNVPAELRSSHGRQGGRYEDLVVPRSCRRRVSPILRARIRRLARRLTSPRG